MVSYHISVCELMTIQSHSKGISDQCIVCVFHPMASCMRVAAKMVLYVCGRTRLGVRTACGNVFSPMTCPARLLSTMAVITLSSRLKYRQLLPACSYVVWSTPLSLLKITHFHCMCFTFFVHFYCDFVQKNICCACCVVCAVVTLIRFDRFSFDWLLSVTS